MGRRMWVRVRLNGKPVDDKGSEKSSVRQSLDWMKEKVEEGVDMAKENIHV